MVTDCFLCAVIWAWGCIIKQNAAHHKVLAQSCDPALKTNAIARWAIDLQPKV